MSARQLTAGDAVQTLGRELDLHWVAGHEGKTRLLTRDLAPGKRPRLLGPLNFNSPNRIQLMGAAEVRLFSQSASVDATRFEYSLPNTCDMIVISDMLPPPPSIVDLAEREHIALLSSSLDYSQLHSRMRFLLTQLLAEREIIHGVMMDVHGTGVLITGDASVGKSELALELISRGHILVADDAPEFTRIAPGTLECQCPPLLQDFLEVRGLGVLNIALMYGDAHTRSRKILRCIVHLKPVSGEDFGEELAAIAGDRISEPAGTRLVLGVNVPKRTIPVAPGRNMAVLVEAAVRDQILRAGGYSASKDLVSKQERAMVEAAGRLQSRPAPPPKSGTDVSVDTKSPP
ncbi:MAG: HPr(Ser) kinase/phosphatase [Granulosicoccus sp.]|nr:HPr(Ser) kinase/phosphatase [Granulosicoccus sp.]